MENKELAIVENDRSVASNKNKLRLLVTVGLLGLVSSAFATEPTLTVNYTAFGTAVLGQIQSMFTAIIPIAAVLFGAYKGIMWVRSIL